MNYHLVGRAQCSAFRSVPCAAQMLSELVIRVLANEKERERKRRQVHSDAQRRWYNRKPESEQNERGFTA